MGAFGHINLGRILLVSIVTAIMSNMYILLEKSEFLRHLLRQMSGPVTKKK